MHSPVDEHVSAFTPQTVQFAPFAPHAVSAVPDSHVVREQQPEVHVLEQP